MLIIKPQTAERAYELAANIFSDFCEKVTGEIIKTAKSDDGKSDVVVIGSDSVNDFLMEEMFKEKVSNLKIRYGTDDYCIRSYTDGKRKILILAGGRGRSTIYAVYDYFERFCGCHYFWDGDVIPSLKKLPFNDIDIVESPRFEYRGLRYFAHRGLKRFQAEHWGYDDWKHEIDWIMKKRLNFFMLRIGMDDVWQKAFPDIVSYPSEYNNMHEKYGFTDRTDFWTLKYRGELRKKVMEYIRENDIISPTDCGTMTHWYSTTPEEFLKSKKPQLLTQADNRYNEFDSGCVFDFRKRENMDYYMKLTETMAEEYGDNNAIFHTIGLGERRMYKEDKKNFMLKLFCYRRIAQSLREKYPNSKLLVGTWDFVGWWRPEEVQNLVNEFDPERTLIFDYTSEGCDEIQNFTNWGVIGKFSWIFGLFHAYESESELRGPYELINKRLKMAVEDSFCKGMVLWPELSHSDPIVLEYLSENSWSPIKSVGEVTKGFCYKRYGKKASAMNSCWQQFLPFMELASWGGYVKVETEDSSFLTDSLWDTHNDIWVKPFVCIEYLERHRSWDLTYKFFKEVIPKAVRMVPDVADVIALLAEINAETNEIFILRDSIDIVRTVCGRFLNYMLASVTFGLCEKEKIKEIRKRHMLLLKSLSKLISFNQDFSLYVSLKELGKNAPVNPQFEKTLKNNILDGYCRQCCNEIIDYILVDESELTFDYIESVCKIDEAHMKKKEIVQRFMDKPLFDMQKTVSDTLPEVMSSIAEQVRKLPEIF